MAVKELSRLIFVKVAILVEVASIEPLRVEVSVPLHPVALVVEQLGEASVAHRLGQLRRRVDHGVREVLGRILRRLGEGVARPGKCVSVLKVGNYAVKVNFAVLAVEADCPLGPFIINAVALARVEACSLCLVEQTVLVGVSYVEILSIHHYSPASPEAFYIVKASVDGFLTWLISCSLA